MSNAFLKNLVFRQTDRIEEPLTFGANAKTIMVSNVSAFMFQSLHRSIVGLLRKFVRLLEVQVPK